MNDPRQLVTDYVRYGSETAFRELVTRYVDLVYSTALRLVGGDSHLAEDVTQTVFIQLARKARRLSPNVLMGGWLHRATCNAARAIIRSEQRRQRREQQAVEMNAIQVEGEDNLTKLTPVLDEALEELGAEDRAAILLRFFEQRQFGAVGEILGIGEDGARKRVNRALDKLETLLKRRGVTFSSLALGTFLATDAVTAAPAGLAASVAGAALAGITAGTTTLTLVKTLAMTKVKLGALSALIIAGVTTPLVVQHQTQARLARQNQELRNQLSSLAELQAENERLSNAVARLSQPGPVDSEHELLQLRSEVGTLRSQVNNLQNQNRQLQTAQTRPAPEPQPEQTNHYTAQQLVGIAKMNDARLLTQGLILYAQNNGQQLPSRFEQIQPYLKDANLGTNQFDLVAQGSLQDITNPAQVIVFRETQAWQTPDGGWVRTYGFADGHSEIHRPPDGNFEPWEKLHMLAAPDAGH